MFHDQGDDMAAANVLDGMLKTVDANTYVALPARITSVLQRFYLFRKKSPPDKIIEAHHRRGAGEEILSGGLPLGGRRRSGQSPHMPWQRPDLDPSDIDVLIACYRLPDQTPEYRKKVMDLIRQATEDIRVEIAAGPDNAEYYNQFAWLIANTEGDLDEALKYAQKSLELSPENGGLYDTLGACTTPRAITKTPSKTNSTPPNWNRTRA